MSEATGGFSLARYVRIFRRETWKHKQTSSSASMHKRSGGGRPGGTGRALARVRGVNHPAGGPSSPIA